MAFPLPAWYLFCFALTDDRHGATCGTPECHHHVCWTSGATVRPPRPPSRLPPRSCVLLFYDFPLIRGSHQRVPPAVSAGHIPSSWARLVCSGAPSMPRRVHRLLGHRIDFRWRLGVHTQKFTRTSDGSWTAPGSVRTGKTSNPHSPFRQLLLDLYSWGPRRVHQTKNNINVMIPSCIFMVMLR